MDCVLIQHGRAHQIWRGVRKTKLPPLHPDLLAQIVEAKSGTVHEGDVWDGKVFQAPPGPDPKQVAQADLKRSDAAMARIAEDLIDALIGKGVLSLADLPERAHTHIAARKALRASLKAQQD